MAGNCSVSAFESFHRFLPQLLMAGATPVKPDPTESSPEFLLKSNPQPQSAFHGDVKKPEPFGVQSWEQQKFGRAAKAGGEE